MNLSIVSIKSDAESFLTTGKGLLEKSQALVIVKTEDVQVASSILESCQLTEKELEKKRLEITKPLNTFVTEVNTLFKETANPILEAKNVIKTKILAYNQEQERIRKAEELRLFEEERVRLQKLEEERLIREKEEAEKRRIEEEKLEKERQRLRDLEEKRLQEELKARQASEEEQKKAREEAERQRLEREKLENEKIELERQRREIEEEKKRIEEEKLLEERRKKEAEELAKKQEELKVKGVVKRWSYEVTDENVVPRSYCSVDSKKINAAIKNGVREIEGIRIFQQTDVR